MAQDRRRPLFLFLFGEETGYLCIATRSVVTKKFQEVFFQLPNQLDDALEYASRQTLASDVWFCPTLLTGPQRIKQNVAVSTCLWADLDDCDYQLLLVPPSLVMQTSNNRFQAIWKLSTPVHAYDAERVNKRIAYKHADQGADKSGWDLTQLLRVPFTSNHKYPTKPKVLVDVAKSELIYTLEDFDIYPALEDESNSTEGLIAESLLPEETSTELIEKYSALLNPRVWNLLEEAPEGTWSELLWELQLILFEAGMTPGEVFTVAKAAPVNKYARDNKPDSFLWKEVARAAAVYESKRHTYVADLSVAGWTPEDYVSVPLLTDDERKWIEANPSIIDRYMAWANTIGDAAWQYHQVGAFVVLSSLLAGPVRLPTSFGVLVPNLWFMILADTTLTRKTTAMDLAVDILVEIDSDAVLATDGSVEGLMTSLATRPGRPSVFLRDEFSGLLDQFAKRDYYAGMMETLTKLYDGKFQKRVLRKEIIEVRDPILILFAGGIRQRVLGALNLEHVGTGFLPRFVFVTAESDVTRLRPLGPPTEKSIGSRDELISEFRDIWRNYRTDNVVSTNGREYILPKMTNATLTPDAWILYNKMEARMLEAALRSPLKDMMTPMFDRLSKSGLKAATLLAAARRLGNTVIVQEEDIIRAFYYIEQWREFTLDILSNLGKSAVERTIERVYEMIRQQPGIQRGKVMQRFWLTSRDAEVYFSTLEQRGLIKRSKMSGQETFTANHMIIPVPPGGLDVPSNSKR